MHRLPRKTKGAIVFVLLFIVTTSFYVALPSKEFLIKDEKTAIEFAKVLWSKYYGGLIKKTRPYTAEIQKDSIWVVKGTVHAKKGGRPYLEFNAYDCKVYKMWFDK